MTSADRSAIPSWYVLNYVAGPSRKPAFKEIEQFNSVNSSSLQLFAPTYVVREERQGEIRMRTVSLTFHYVFVRGTLPEIKQLCISPNGFSFLIDRSSEERYAVIDDARMAGFMNIARAYRNCLPYFSLEDIDLEDGDVVEVIRGDFPGLVGTYIPRPRSNSGDIALHVYNNVGTMAFNVKASDVRVIEFARNSTRANDQIDAFMPHLLKALRLYAAGEPLTTTLAAKLSMFCGRMEVARLNSRTPDARLQLMLHAASHIIGNMAQSAASLGRYEKLKDSVTNPWTCAAHTLVLAVISGDHELLASGYEAVKALEATSKAHRMIVDEYAYYLAGDLASGRAATIQETTI